MGVMDYTAAELRMLAHTTASGTQIFQGANTAECAAILLAAAQGNCAAVPWSPRMTPTEIEALHAQIDGRELAPGIYIATSGSQGRPKLAHLSPQALQAHARAVNQHLGVSADDVWLACLPFFHVGGMAVVLRCVEADARVRISASTDAEEIANLLDGVTFVSLVPTMLRRVLTILGDRLPKSVRGVIVGGGPIPRDLIERCPQALPTYGLTEAGSMVTCARPGCDEQERFTAGPSLPHAAVRIVDEESRAVQQGVAGRIVVQSSGAASGYWQNENETARTFRAGWIHTEDAGYLDERGNLIVVGRRDRIIVSGGENISLDEIEAALRAMPGVDDALCVGLADTEWGVTTAAILETKQRISLESLRDALRSNLAGHKLPRAVRCVAQLPLLPNGKPDYETARKLLG